VKRTAVPELHPSPEKVVICVALTMAVGRAMVRMIAAIGAILLIVKV
jgi:hypothetical protein